MIDFTLAELLTGLDLEERRMSPAEVDKLPYRHERPISEIAFKGFDESQPWIVTDSNGVSFTIGEWADGTKYKEPFAI